MKTYGDFFTGFGGMTCGAKAAGLDVVFGVEYDADLAAVYRRNFGDHVLVEDLTTFDVAQLPRVDVFHASPVCTRASQANPKAVESPLDLATAEATLRYIAHALPDIVTIENVYAYRKFESWRLIARGLLRAGYTYSFWHVNMADHGVPQTRKRMIVVARRDGVNPSLPDATHAKEPVATLFGALTRWVSWHEVISDLSFEGGAFPDWATVPDYGDLIINAREKHKGEGTTVRMAHEPVFTVSATAPAYRYVARIGGRVVKMTPRAIARFQSFPDSYELPESATLAVKGIGNAVPPLFAEKLYKHLSEVAQ